jgi:predicted nucleic acid-binding protein
VIYLLDTTAISALIREDKRMASWLSFFRVDDRVVICTITGGEILFGL